MHLQIFLCLLLCFTSCLLATNSPVRESHNKAANMKVELRGFSSETSISRNGSMELLERLAEPTPKEQEAQTPPMFPLSGCFWCPRQAVLQGDGWKLLAEFTTELFMRTTRATTDDLIDKCIFYSMDIVSPAGDPTRGLSRKATQLACDLKKYSIWHLWPNKINEANNNKLLNYYGIFLPDNRLYKISQLGNFPNTGKPGRIQYFENMSRAMARMCSGQIYLYSQTPENLQLYGIPPQAPNIWHNVELAELRSRRILRGNSLIVINASDPNHGAWRVNWQTLGVEGPGMVVRRDDWEPYDLTAEITYGPQKRSNLCVNSGIADQPAGMDFFA